MAVSIHNLSSGIISDAPPAFESLTMKISDREVPITSLEEMRRIAFETAQKSVNQHVQIRLDIPERGPQKKQALAFIRELEKTADVISTRWDDIFYVFPKKIEESARDGLTIRKYTNGVVEEVEPSDRRTWEDWNGRRIYPNGKVESGVFDRCFLRKGNYVSEGKLVYRSPNTCVASHGLGLGLMYYRERVIVLQSIRSIDYVEVEMDPILALTQILQKEGYGKETLGGILSGPIDAQAFVDSLLETNAIFSIDPYSLESLLQIICEKGLSVNLCKEHPETRETILDLHANDSEILRLLLTIQPSLLQRKEGVETSFVKVLLSGNQNSAAILIGYMESQFVEMTPRERIFQKVAFGEAISLEDLGSVSSEDLKIVYQLANIYSRLDVLAHLRTLGFGRKEDLLMQEGPAILAGNMDALEMHDSLKGFLQQMRRDGLLLTRAEFSSRHRARDYVEKGNDIGRVLGRNYIEKKAEYGSVKVPKKLIVLEGGSLSLKVENNLDLRVISEGVTVYAEKIERAGRLTYKQAEDLLGLLSECGFTDIHWGNFIVGSDGVYVIDTEFTNFWLCEYYFERGGQIAAMADIVHALPISEQEPLINLLNDAIREYCEKEESLKNTRAEQRQASLAALEITGCIHGPQFTFSIKDLSI